MKLTAAILLWLISSFSIQAQVPGKQHYLNVYKRAIKYNDVRTAIASLQNYLAIDDEIRYKDTLGTLYLLASDYYSSLLISKEVLDVEKTNLSAMERVAECFNQLGDLKSAVEHYEKLSAATKNANHYYKLAEAQYQLKRIAECTQNLQYVIADTNSKHIPTPFSIGGGKAQNVPILAAAYNMLGVIQMELKENANATKLFTKAMEAYPDFIGAYQNLEELKKRDKQSGKPEVKQKPVKPKNG